MAQKKATVSVQLPDREADEPDITEEQFTEIRGHDVDLETPFLRSLGKYQAAVLLRKIEEYKLFGAPEQWTKKSRNNTAAALLSLRLRSSSRCHSATNALPDFGSYRVRRFLER